ncbi:hypothetical protein Fcan01_24604 [Folsomia candida]|uniref:Uncharacterized protein n=1 Tax=Folsomia candida TaxID=158441 RepID=A0A226D718_FOLCA|nr:hypothetical protein Fcan01_24604 [Folsomia candida]
MKAIIFPNKLPIRSSRFVASPDRVRVGVLRKRCPQSSEAELHSDRDEPDQVFHKSIFHISRKKVLNTGSGGYQLPSRVSVVSVALCRAHPIMPLVCYGTCRITPSLRNFDPKKLLVPAICFGQQKLKM